jgi:hypothetical protein
MAIDKDVLKAMEELKNNKAAKKLARQRPEDFSLYSDSVDDFDVSELGSNFSFGSSYGDSDWN